MFFEKMFEKGSFRVWNFRRKGKTQRLVLETNSPELALDTMVSISKGGKYSYVTVQKDKSVSFYSNASDGEVFESDLRPLVKSLCSR